MSSAGYWAAIFTHTSKLHKANTPILTFSVLANCGLYFEAIEALTVGFPQEWPSGLGVMICSLEHPPHCLI